MYDADANDDKQHGHHRHYCPSPAPSPLSCYHLSVAAYLIGDLLACRENPYQMCFYTFVHNFMPLYQNMRHLLVKSLYRLPWVIFCTTETSPWAQYLNLPSRSNSLVLKLFDLISRTVDCKLFLHSHIDVKERHGHHHHQELTDLQFFERSSVVEAVRW